MTERNCEQLEFHCLGLRAVVALFDGGALLLREVEAKTGLLAAIAKQFTDHRDSALIEHTATELVCRRRPGTARNLARRNVLPRQSYSSR